MANKLTFDKRTIDAIAAHVAKGGSVSAALRILGMAKQQRTFSRYMRDAKQYVENGIEPTSRGVGDAYIELIEYLYEAIAKADAEGEERHVDNMNRLAEAGGATSFAASKFMLKTRYGWQEQPVEHIHRRIFEGTENDDVEDMARLTTEELKAIAAGEIVEGELIDD